MRNKLIAVAAALMACLCLGGTVAVFALLFQVPYGLLPFVRASMLQRWAQSQACQAPATLVPGTYLADPLQTAGHWVMVAYTAECATPGQPGRLIIGYMAVDEWGSGCGTSREGQSIAPAASGPVTISDVGLSQCEGTGGSAGLTIIPGYITGPSAVTAEILFASGPSASATVRAGRFVIAASNGAAICSVRALDASGAVLVENRLNWPMQNGSAGACP